MGHSKAEAEITRRIYRCVLDEAQWPGLLRQLTSAFDSTYSTALARNLRTGSVRIMATDALPTERQRAYETHYYCLQPTSFFNVAALAIGDVITDGSYQEYDAYLGSELYNDFFRPLNAHHLMFVKFREDAIEAKSLVLRRSRKTGFYGRNEIERLRRLSSHLCNAEDIRVKVQAAENRAADVITMLDRLGVAAFITDRDAGIRYLTGGAEQLLRNTQIFSVRSGRLASNLMDFERELMKAIRACADSVDHAGGEPRRTLRVGEPGDAKLPTTVSVSAIVWRDAKGFEFPASLVLTSDPHVQWNESVSMVAQLFSLTAAESKLAVALCEGRSLAAYAADAHISILTARTLLKRAQEKTGTHSQVELVSMLFRSGAFLWA